ncbi:uncharacterized protein MELLADRAFT_47483 [Melampsora larici-populina 98AG31]|uniref:L-lactate dehydrogenase (cytochrome) n=1 Tax=Melampsora larici-populina (strain 98AG31 / pathotype 3-4-7) TaxID=747676 RepID=F4RDM8_MELLP|nr:uncharacterized protein MELLADRAFT_47483 [Melampsora larici-populina 98AG31]EGG09427.1 hypothetical protein MELLADRAFT_47483 [Melampsora larici-populina 98AG31]
MLKANQIKQHSTLDSCWLVIHGHAFDVTEFLPDHPGGQAILLKYAGADATEAYDPIHPPGTIEEYLPKEKHLGKVDPSELKALQLIEKAKNPNPHPTTTESLPPLSNCLSLYDFESLAETKLSSQAWAYYSSGSDDEISMRENRLAFQRIWFRPRILRNVSKIDFSTNLLGSKTSIPIYITATALGKLGHVDGEKNLTRAAEIEDVIQMIPTLSSVPFLELSNPKHQSQWFQLYVNADRVKTEALVKRAEANGIKALFITVDAPQLGRREKDMRLKFETLGSDLQENESIDKSQGATRAISSFIDSSLCWDDIPWFKSITKLPIILKGVQTWEDAVLAYEYGLQGVVLSNHGGRQLDYARSGIEVLEEVVQEFKKRSIYDLNKFEIYVDGGIRRSSDVLKALCLGAKAVGIGRPFLYAYSTYGVPGVVRAIQILKDELEMDMRLIGAPTLDDLRPEMLDISSLKNRSADTLPDYKFRQNYQPLPKITPGASKL